MKFSVCTDAVYRREGMEEGLRRLHQLGVHHYEFWSWWDKDLARIESLQAELNMTPVAFCTRMKSLLDPALLDDYVDGLRDSLQVARRLGAKALISQTGQDNGRPREEQLAQMVQGLRACVPLLEDAGVTLLVEPLNTHYDHPGYFLSRSDEGFAIIEEVGSPSVKLLFDLYHQQVSEGNLIPTVTANLDKIGHFHAAGHPGRHELDSGEIHYPAVWEALEKAGYDGYVGLEYFPLDEPDQGIQKLLRHRNEKS